MAGNGSKLTPFQKGNQLAKGSPGRPKSKKSREHLAEHTMKKAEVGYEGNLLDYIEAHIAARAKAGLHSDALDLALKLLPYKHPKIASVDSEEKAPKALEITFGEANAPQEK